MVPNTPDTKSPDSRSPEEKKAFVRNKFSKVTRRYDILNTVLSLSIDRHWRNRTVSLLVDSPKGMILDLCAGTLPLSNALWKRLRRPVIALDFCLDMLLYGRHRTKGAAMILPVQGDAETLPFVDEAFGGITMAFGLRNLANPQQGLMEMYRVVKPGGIVAILEFSRPRHPVVSKTYLFYLHKVLPKIGGLISGDREAYEYLAESIQEFPAPEVVAAMMNGIGFKDVSYEQMTLGIVTLYHGKRPSMSSGILPD